MSHYITVAQTAEHIGVTERTVRRYIAEGRITGVRIGPKMIRVEAASLDRLAKPMTPLGGDAA